MNRRTISQAAACLAALTCSSLASAQSYSESFDTLAAGSAIEGQAGFKNWDVCATGNQAFNTVSNLFASNGNNSLRIVPAGSACPGCSDTTHELNGPYTSGQWTMTIDTYIPTGFTGRALIIMLNTYNDCGGPYDWSAQVRLNGLGNCRVDNLNNNVPINGLQPIIYDTWVELKMEIDLDNNSVIYSYNDVQMVSADWTTTGVQEIAALDLFPATDATTEWFVDNISLTSGISTGGIGTNYCSANPNSTGSSSSMSATGSASVALNDLTLVATGLPPLGFGFFITGPASGFVQNPGGSSGNLCISGSIGRYVAPGQIQNSGLAGTIDLLIDSSAIPTPLGPVAMSPGSTRFFQLWHRDSNASGPTSNFTDGLEVTFN